MENTEQKSCCGSDGECKCHCHVAKHIVLGIFAVVLIVYIGLLARNAMKNFDYIGKSLDQINLITVSGIGKVSATPDIAVLSIGVISDSLTVSQATKDNTEKMNKIVDAIKNQFKVESKDVQTFGYNVSPKYDWTGGQQRIIGYTVSQNVAVKVRDFTKTGDIISKSTELGANSVSGPQFSIDNPEKFQQDARAIAIKQAKDKAQIMADQVGIKLGRIVNYYEGGQENSPIPMYAKADGIAFGMGGGASASIAPPIESGSQDVQINVNISYEIK